VDGLPKEERGRIEPRGRVVHVSCDCSKVAEATERPDHSVSATLFRVAHFLELFVSSLELEPDVVKVSRSRKALLVLGAFFLER
jgi:hypothetical protein